MKLNLDKNKKYLLACSYGGDSMALFHLLLTNKYNFAAAFVNYNVRPESVKEENDLTNYCQTHKIKLFKKSAPIFDKGNFQNNARIFRYNFFKDVKTDYDYDVLLVAHHKDDFLESYFLQKRRKTKLMQLGIARESNVLGLNVVRPLLDYFKQDLVHYCTINNIPYAIDKSNLESDYQRNYVRNNILNNYTNIEKQKIYLEVVSINEQNLKHENTLKNYIKNGSVIIDKYLSLKKEDQETIIYLLFKEKGIQERYTNNVFNNISDLIGSKNTSREIKLYDNIYLIKSYTNFRLIYSLDYVPYQVKVGHRGVIETKHFTMNTLQETDIYNIYENSFPLLIRTYNKGDTYLIGENNKDVNRMFIDMKMPKHLRKIWPLVLDKNNKIIYIPRYRKDYDKSKPSLFTLMIED